MNRNTIGVFICDDDPINLGVNQKIVELLAEKHRIEIEIYTYNEFNKEAITLFKANKIDIAILDIELQKEDGITIAQKINKSHPDIPVIFVTGYKKYQSRAWDIMAVGFIEKPTDTEKFELLFLRAITLAKERLKKENNCFLSIFKDKKHIDIRQDNIIYAEKVLRKVNFKTKSNTYSCTSTLKQFENKLIPNFLKISQSVMVNKSYIDSIDSHNVRLTTGEEFVIGRTYHNSVKAFAKTIERDNSILS